MKRWFALLAGTIMAASSGMALAKEDKAMDKKPAAEMPAKKNEKIDINSATAKELAQLPGIGEARGAAIVKGRPYKAKDELVDKKILPKAVYDKVKDSIIAKQ